MEPRVKYDSMSYKNEEQGKPPCRCLKDNVLLEGLVVLLTVVSCLAITGHLLVDFDFIEVLTDSHDAPDNTSLLIVSGENDREPGTYKAVDEDIMDILKVTFCYTNLGIVGLFVIEVLSKLVTLRKEFLTKPVQLLDSLVVLSDAAFQTCFYVLSIPNVFYCCSYVIVLRLWRACFICNVRTNYTTRLAMEQCTYERAKVEDRCKALENKLLLQEVQIKELQMLRTRLTHVDEKVDRVSGILVSHDDLKNNNTISPSSYVKGEQTDMKSGDNQPKQPQVSEDLKQDDGTSMDKAEKGRNNSSKNIFKPRWRRSSTSDFDDRRMSVFSNISNVSGMRNVASAENILCSIENETDVTSVNEIDGSLVSLCDRKETKSMTLSVSGVSLDMDDASDSKSFSNRRNSCPEYMFTQRMKISTYEVMLIDDHDMSEALTYDNGAYSPEDSFPMMALSPLQKINTYRRQNGVPTTVL